MNLADNLKNSTERFPDRTAIVFYDRRIRYEELYSDVTRFAAALRGMEIERRDRVAIALPNVPEFVVALYGALAAGAEVVSINPLYTAREIGYMLRDAKVKLAIVHPMFETAVREAARESPMRILYSDAMGDPAKVDIRKVIAEEKGSLDPTDCDPHDTALIIYTNAYRGYPLGACLTHEGLIFDAEACRQVSLTDENDTFITVIPLYHAFSTTVCLNLPLCAGGKTVLHEIFKEDRVINDIEKEKVSIFPSVPTIYSRLLDTHGRAGKDFSFVKAFIPGGAPLPLDLFHDFKAAFNAMVYEGYGITECGPVTTSNPIYKRECKPGSIGPPLNGISVKIVGEDGSELPQGGRGEIAVRGKNVMREYLNQPEETAKFLKDGWFFTGDLGWKDEDDFIFITGRKKRMILVGGFNVYPLEVENFLCAHPAVSSCRVYGEPDAVMGEKVMAEVVPRPGVKVDAKELRQYLRAGLAPYKTPRRVEIIGEGGRAD